MCKLGAVLILTVSVFTVHSKKVDVQNATLDQVNEKTDGYKEIEHVDDSLGLLIYLILLTVAILTSWVFKKKRFKFIHESGVSVILGLIIGAILRYTGPDHKITSWNVSPITQNNDYGVPPNLLKMNISGQTFVYSITGPESNMKQEELTDIQEKATFDPEIFFYLILPPIIFNAGYSMRKKHFFHNIGSILTFALLGTVISTFVIAGIMWLVVQTMSIQMTFLETLHFGCIISATDPVTTLAIFTDLNVDPTLNGLVLGESLLNDAVALVLVGSLEDYSKLFDNVLDSDASQVGAVFKAILHFFSIFFGSVGLGALMGIVTALLTKYTHIREYPILETSLFFLLSYSSYLIAEVASMSGIVSVLFCGICQAHYTFSNLSQESKVRTRQLFELLNFLMENFIFSYIGVSMFTFSRHRFEFLFIAGAFFAIGVARALNIYPLSLILNVGRKKKIALNYQHMMWFAGLRGALSFALAIKNTLTESRQIFLTTTSLIAIFTVIFCGGLTTPLLGLLKIPIGVLPENATEETTLCAEREGYEEPEPESQRSSSQVRRSALARTWKSIDSAVLKPLLTHCRPTLMDTMQCLGPVARWLTTDEQLTGDSTFRDDDNESYGKYERKVVDSDENSLSHGD